MCLVRALKTGLLAKAMEPWLSLKRGIGEGGATSRSPSIFVSQINSLPASTVARYLASVVDKMTTGCLCDDQLTAPPMKEKTYPETDRQVSGSPAQSESTKLVQIIFEGSPPDVPENVMP